jgi:uncharacterized protein YndB with AHSA1/START domain
MDEPDESSRRERAVIGPVTLRRERGEQRTQARGPSNIPGPAIRVFEAWTDPKHLARFMCPGRMDSAKVTADARVGGTFHIDMVGEAGTVYPHDGTYLEVDPPRRLKFTWISLACPAELNSVVTIDFVDRDGSTELILIHESLTDEKSRDGHTVGWTAILTQLENAIS